ncbi:MAG: hypothetical protein WEA09_14085 [Gemmatimonadota bacterium]
MAGTLILATVLSATDELRANGGTLRLADVAMGAYRVSVFTDPTPVRPDSLDVSVLVLQEGVDGVADGVEVWVQSRSLDSAAEGGRWAATREQADDPRYYAAKFPLGHEGTWEIQVEIRGEAGEGSASFQIQARERGFLGHPFAVLFVALLPLAGATWWVLRGGESPEDDRSLSSPTPPH